MPDLKSAVRDVPDFPRPGILFRDIAPLLREHFDATLDALEALLGDAEWDEIDAVAGIESRGFILGAPLAARRGKGFVLVRKQGKLPPPVVDVAYDLEYGSGILEMQKGSGDSFAVTETPVECAVVDMEAYALAKVCFEEGAGFACAKYVTDGADGAAPEDWHANVHKAAESFLTLYRGT
jgi:adenine phosphoribosyltransferase